MAGRFLKLFSPFVRITPEIKAPNREISFRDKLIYTVVVLVIYVIMSNVPIVGYKATEGTDYYYWLRVILASQRGTLTELGIGPIVTAGLIMQLLQGSKLISVNMGDPSDRALFTGAQKVMAILLTIFQIVAYIYGGAFGAQSSIVPLVKVAIFLQLFFASVIIMMLDEILQKGYGLGSGVSLFIATGVAGQIFWNMFAFVEAPGTGSDRLPRGIVIAFFDVLFNPGENLFPLGHSLYVGGVDTVIKLRHLWIRDAGAPGILGFLTTILIFFGVVYVESMRVEIPLTYAGYKGYRGKYPMKLLYVSNIPVILAQALYANVLFFGQLLWQWGGEKEKISTWIGLIGRFTQNEGESYMTPTGGLIKYLTPPQGLSALITAIRDGKGFGDIVLQSIIYLVIFIVLCIFLGQIWVEVSGLAPRDIAGQIINSKMQIPGFRQSEKVIERILKRYIPPLTILCGFIVGFLSFTADFIGALSSGTGLLLTVGIVQNYAETISKEVAAEQMPGMKALLGT